MYYDIYRIEGKEKANEVKELVEQFPLQIINNITDETFLEAGRLKAAYRISLADAIAVAEARRLHVKLLSSDHHEFDILEEKHEVEMVWIR